VASIESTTPTPFVFFSVSLSLSSHSHIFFIHIYYVLRLIAFSLISLLSLSFPLSLTLIPLSFHLKCTPVPLPFSYTPLASSRHSYTYINPVLLLRNASNHHLRSLYSLILARRTDTDTLQDTLQDTRTSINCQASRINFSLYFSKQNSPNELSHSLTYWSPPRGESNIETSCFF
jgi:hypothetical protein